MNGYEAYKLYLAIKLHFSTEDYDFIKHNGKVNCSLDSFTKRNDKYFFHRLSTRFKDEELLNFYVANFSNKPKRWIGELIREDGESVYRKWQKYNESFAYNFRADCSTINNDIARIGGRFDDWFNVHNGQHPKLLRLYLSKRLGTETMVTFNKILSFIPNWDKKIAEKVVWPEVSFRLKNYSRFVKYNTTKCKFIMKEIFV